MRFPIKLPLDKIIVVKQIQNFFHKNVLQGADVIERITAIEQADLTKPYSVVMRYELPECMVGWPSIELEADAGVIVEVSVQEYVPQSAAWQNQKFHGYSRHISMKGDYGFTSYDYETGKYIQLHIDVPRGAKFVIKRVGMRRRRLISDYENSSITSDGARKSTSRKIAGQV